jgi:thiol-disulfide isomerase/thioredoxin
MKKLFTTLALTLGIIATVNAQYENTKMKIGQKAPDLAFNSPEGKKIVLSEINKGRYVLLDFWASWCGPCRHANPGLVKLYQEYSTKKFKNARNGFTVVSVSMDKDKDKWIGAIKQDNLIWPYHMSDLVDWNTGNCATANTYGVQYIPQAFLIGPDGKIIGKYGAAEGAEGDIKRFVAE